MVGVTGLLILDAIVAGERDPQQLARFKNGRVKASRDTIARSLNGNWQPEHLFALQQALATWRHYRARMVHHQIDVGGDAGPVPQAPRRPTVHEAHGQRRDDDYAWLPDTQPAKHF